jgi:enoyl-CoA hydratase/carnithine racemase
MTRAFSVETDVVATQFENVIVEKVDGGVALVTLNRPKALNALCYALF